MADVTFTVDLDFSAAQRSLDAFSARVAASGTGGLPGAVGGGAFAGPAPGGGGPGLTEALLAADVAANLASRGGAAAGAGAVAGAAARAAPAAGAFFGGAGLALPLAAAVPTFAAARGLPAAVSSRLAGLGISGGAAGLALAGGLGVAGGVGLVETLRTLATTSLTGGPGIFDPFGLGIDPETRQEAVPDLPITQMLNPFRLLGTPDEAGRISTFLGRQTFAQRDEPFAAENRLLENVRKAFGRADPTMLAILGSTPRGQLVLHRLGLEAQNPQVFTEQDPALSPLTAMARFPAPLTADPALLFELGRGELQGQLSSIRSSGAQGSARRYTVW